MDFGNARATNKPQEAPSGHPGDSSSSGPAVDGSP